MKFPVDSFVVYGSGNVAKVTGFCGPQSYMLEDFDGMSLVDIAETKLTAAAAHVVDKARKAAKRK